MWLTMYACYLLNLLTLVLLGLTALQGYIPFPLINANHAATALIAIILYLFTQTLIIFFFTGTGVNIRDYVQENNLDKELHERSKAIKYKLFSPLLLNMAGNDGHLYHWWSRAYEGFSRLDSWPNVLDCHCPLHQNSYR